MEDMDARVLCLDVQTGLKKLTRGCVRWLFIGFVSAIRLFALRLPTLMFYEVFSLRAHGLRQRQRGQNLHNAPSEGNYHAKRVGIVRLY